MQGKNTQKWHYKTFQAKQYDQDNGKEMFNRKKGQVISIK